MTYQVRFTAEAEADLVRLYEFIIERDPTDVALAERALEAIRSALLLLLQFPFTCRKASADNPFLRELVIPFGGDGYVALFDVSDANTVTVIAVRYQRENDYH